LNNGVVLVRNSQRGRFFVELLLEKTRWGHTIQHDQGAFDETVLEVLELERRAAELTLAAAEPAHRAVAPYESHCLLPLLPSIEGHELVALYAMCWWSQAESLVGKAGQRQSRVIQFVDPRVLDMNNVVGVRGTDVPAFLYHFAGRSKEWDEMLAKFGIPRRHTADCAKVFRHVDAAAAAKTCVPGNAGVEDLFGYCEPPLAVC